MCRSKASGNVHDRLKTETIFLFVLRQHGQRRIVGIAFRPHPCLSSAERGIGARESEGSSRSIIFATEHVLFPSRSGKLHKLHAPRGESNHAQQ